MSTQILHNISQANASLALQTKSSGLDLYHASSVLIHSSHHRLKISCNLWSSSNRYVWFDCSCKTLWRGKNFFNPFPQWDFCKLCTPILFFEEFPKYKCFLTLFILEIMQKQSLLVYIEQQSTSLRNFSIFCTKDKINHL